jgi:dTDP-glucose 4,6-dehydratase
VQIKDRVKVVWADLSSPVNDITAAKMGNPDIVCHMAAQTHVDFSIVDPVGTIYGNVMSTVHLLEWARKQPNLQKFLYFSTDEVWGSCPDDRPAYTELDRLNPTNPYSCSKAASESICNAYWYTYKIPIVITNCMNVYGRYQGRAKFPALVVKNVLAGETVYIHASDSEGTKVGSRHYIHTTDISRGVMLALEKLPIGEKLNIIGKDEINNLDFAHMIAKIIGKPLKWEYLDFTTSPKGSSADIRYHISDEKLLSYGFQHEVKLEDGLKDMVDFYLNNQEWLA